MRMSQGPHRFLCAREAARSIVAARRLGNAWVCGESGRRYKKKVEKDEDYLKTVKTLTSSIEGDIKQNFSIDIYQVSRSTMHARARMLRGCTSPRSVSLVNARANDDMAIERRGATRVRLPRPNDVTRTARLALAGVLRTGR